MTSLVPCKAAESFGKAQQLQRSLVAPWNDSSRQTLQETDERASLLFSLTIHQCTAGRDLSRFTATRGQLRDSKHSCSITPNRDPEGTKGLRLRASSEMWDFFTRMLPAVNEDTRFAASRQRPGPIGSPEPEVTAMSSAGNNNEPQQFYPDLLDALKVRYLLQYKLTEAIPPEIVDLIVDAAEYWPSSETRLGDGTRITNDMDRELLRTAPLCTQTTSAGTKLLPHRTAHPCRKIVFTIASHDQGWGGGQKGSYKASYTWFDAVVLPSTQEEWLEDEVSATESTSKPKRRSFQGETPYFLPTRNKLQSNKTAERDTQHYTITWHHEDAIDPASPEAEEIEQFEGRGRATLDGQRVRQMGLGDSVSVIGRARFPGWANHVQQLSVRIFWAV